MNAGQVERAGEGAPRQRSLFPDAFEIQEDALAALDRLEVARAIELVRAARAKDPELALQGGLEAALDFLQRQFAVAAPEVERACKLWLGLGTAAASGELARSAARLLDRTLARWVLTLRTGAEPFLDAGRRLHRAALWLTLGRAAAAASALESALSAGHHRRADLWGYLGDARLALERPEAACECYTRALLFGAGELDLFRLRERRLAALHAELAARRSDALARELLFVHAWLDRIIDLPRPDPWIEDELAFLRARAAGDADRPELRARRFALHLYVDRAHAAGGVDVAAREKMQELEPELFQLCMDELRRRQS